MAKLNLMRYLDGVIAKRLSDVEVVPQKSNQHEFNATSAMKTMLGKQKKTYDTKFVYLSDDSEPVSVAGFMTWYDARERNPLRSEYRLFYKRTAISEMAKTGDCLFLCKLREGTLLAVIAKKDSMMEQRLNWLFGINPADHFEAGNMEALDMSCQVIADYLLRMIGVEVRLNIADMATNLQDLYASGLPNFKELCDMARKHSGIAPDTQNADEVFMSWMNCQEELVCAMLRYLKRLHAGEENAKMAEKYNQMERLYKGNWQDMAMKSHFSVLLRARNIKFEVYSSVSPSLVLPGWEEKKDDRFPAGRTSLIDFRNLMNDSKSTVTGVRTRTPVKYVMTLDPGLTEEKIKSLQSEKIQPVVPVSVQKLYNVKKAFWFMSVEELLLLLSEKQEGRYGN